jgi:sigma-B regulation protein RsbU (phosphoserine phosphatase)
MRASGTSRKISVSTLLLCELLLAALAACVWMLSFGLHRHVETEAIFLYVFVAGNLALALILILRPLSDRWPIPWRRPGYLLLLVAAAVAAAVVAAIPVHLLFLHPPTPFWPSVLARAPLALLATAVVAAGLFLFGDRISRRRAHRRRAGSHVQLGTAAAPAYGSAHGSELQQAHDMQVNLLPRETPQLPGFQIACAWQAAQSVSGDYFDVFAVAEDSLGLIIADISGKGMAAALLMSSLQASVKAFTKDNPSPAELCARLNTALSENIEPGRFVTLFYAVLDARTRGLQYESAGHALPLLVHADGSIEMPAASSGVLGLFSHWTYSDHDLQLAPGDALVLLSDGVLEAWNADEEEFGYQRLIASVLASRNQGADGIRKRVLEDVSAFTKGQFQDDLSLIVVTVEDGATDAAQA